MANPQVALARRGRAGQVIRLSTNHPNQFGWTLRKSAMRKKKESPRVLLVPSHPLDEQFAEFCAEAPARRSEAQRYHLYLLRYLAVFSCSLGAVQIGIATTTPEDSRALNR